MTDSHTAPAHQKVPQAAEYQRLQGTRWRLGPPSTAVVAVRPKRRGQVCEARESTGLNAQMGAGWKRLCLGSQEAAGGEAMSRG